MCAQTHVALPNVSVFFLPFNGLEKKAQFMELETTDVNPDTQTVTRTCGIYSSAQLDVFIWTLMVSMLQQQRCPFFSPLVADATKRPARLGPVRPGPVERGLSLDQRQEQELALALGVGQARIMCAGLRRLARGKRREGGKKFLRLSRSK